MIELVDREVSSSNDGVMVRNTWYVKPFDSALAFMAAMLGNVDPATGSRTLPAHDYEHTYCYCDECDEVPLDPEQFSYMGRGGLPDGGATEIRDVLAGVESPLDPTFNLSTAGFLSQDKKKFAAGAFVKCTYSPVISLARVETEPLDAQHSQTPYFDYINWQLVPKTRDNQINAGLYLITPRLNLNFPGSPVGAVLTNAFYPAVGLSPSFKEGYLQLRVQRRMLSMDTDLAAISAYKNEVNGSALGISTGRIVAGEAGSLFQDGTLRFMDFESRIVTVPQVDGDGNQNGYNKWLDLDLYFDFRTTQSASVYTVNGNLAGAVVPVTWNHVLCHPGWFNTLTQLLVNGAAGPGLAWYRARYAKGLVGLNADPYPADSLENLFEDVF